MKKAILIVAFVHFILTLNAQLKLEKSVDFFNENLNSASIGLDFQNDTLLSYNVENGSLILRFYKLNTLISKRELPLKRFFKKNNCYYEPMCLFQNNTLGIVCGTQLLIANLDSKQELKKFKLKKLKSTCDFFKKSFGNFYLGSYFALDRSFKKMELTIYNIQNDEISNNQFNIDFPVATTVHPNSYFDPLYFSNDSYIVSDVGHYCIRIYQSNHLVDSIKLEDENLFPKISGLDSIAYRRIQVNHLSLTDVTKFNSKIREKCSHIWSVLYLDSNTLLVRVSIPQEKSFVMFDHLWEKTNSKWNITKVKEINPYVQKSNELWPYYSLYNKLIKNVSSLCFIHYAEDNLKNKMFQTDTYFNSNIEATKLHSNIWYFQVD